MVFGQSEHPKTWKRTNKFILKNYQKNIIFPKGFLPNRVKKIFLNLKLRGPLKIVKPKVVLITPRLIHICQKTELKSRWTVPFKV